MIIADLIVRYSFIKKKKYESKKTRLRNILHIIIISILRFGACACLTTRTVLATVKLDSHQRKNENNHPRMQRRVVWSQVIDSFLEVNGTHEKIFMYMI